MSESKRLSKNDVFHKEAGKLGRLFTVVTPHDGYMTYKVTYSPGSNKYGPSWWIYVYENRHFSYIGRLYQNGGIESTYKSVKKLDDFVVRLIYRILLCVIKETYSSYEDKGYSAYTGWYLKPNNVLQVVSTTPVPVFDDGAKEKVDYSDDNRQYDLEDEIQAEEDYEEAVMRAELGNDRPPYKITSWGID